MHWDQMKYHNDGRAQHLHSNMILWIIWVIVKWFAGAKMNSPNSSVAGWRCPLVVVDLAISLKAQPEHIALKHSR
jgi:hypothetical protein